MLYWFSLANLNINCAHFHNFLLKIEHFHSESCWISWKSDRNVHFSVVFSWKKWSTVRINQVKSLKARNIWIKNTIKAENDAWISDWKCFEEMNLSFRCEKSHKKSRKKFVKKEKEASKKRFSVVFVTYDREYIRKNGKFGQKIIRAGYNLFFLNSISVYWFIAEGEKLLISSLGAARARKNGGNEEKSCRGENYFPTRKWKHFMCLLQITPNFTCKNLVSGRDAAKINLIQLKQLQVCQSATWTV